MACPTVASLCMCTRRPFGEATRQCGRQHAELLRLFVLTPGWCGCRSICALSEPLLTPKAALKLNGVGPYIVQKLRPVFAEIAGVGDTESPAAAAPAGQILPHQWGTAGHGLNADTPSLKRTVTAPAATQRRGASTRSYTPVFGKGMSWCH